LILRSERSFELFALYPSAGQVGLGGSVVERKRNRNADIDVAGVETAEVLKVLAIASDQIRRHHWAVGRIRLQTRHLGAGETGGGHRAGQIYLRLGLIVEVL